MLAAIWCLIAAPQTPPRIAIDLEPHTPAAGEQLAWSPKGAHVALQTNGDALVGRFALGSQGAPEIRVRLETSPGQPHRDVLWLDADRNGHFDAAERLTTTPKEIRGKWWSSFEAEVRVPFAAHGAEPARTVPYAMSLWFVADPQAIDAPPSLRWTRRGYSTGRTELGGKPAFVLVTELELDGVLTTADSWALAADPKELLRASSREMTRHCWFETQAYRVTQIEPDGRRIVLEPFAPGTTEAEERAQADVYRADREAPRAAAPLAFGSDFAAGTATAKANGKRVLVDFATTWCGPCKLMDQQVYTAAAVVEAAADVVCVKLDGDQERELVKRFAVAAYPTMLLLDAHGAELRRLVGYQSVKAMVTFLADPPAKTR